MSNNIPVPKGLLRISTSLKYDIFDRSGKLLLRRGTVLQSEELLLRLEDLGFFDPEAIDAPKAQSFAQRRVAPTTYVPDRSGSLISVFDQLQWAYEQLQGLFADQGAELDSAIREVSATIRRCCTIDNDASLAAILLALPFPHVVRHPVNVATLTNVILMRQKTDESRIQSAVAAALTMNIGALALHDELFFWTETLTVEQRTQVRAHPSAGVQSLLARNVKDPLWLAIISQHHEALDGSGYPAGLTGEKILPEAQVVSLADRYCSMVTGRAHRDPMLPPQALKDIHARHGKAISPALIGALIGAMGIYPPGTFVRLANGETAIVVHRIADPKHPVVYALSGPSGTAYDPPRKRLTASQASFAIEQSVPSKEVKTALAPAQLWPPTLAATKPPAGG